MRSLTSTILKSSTEAARIILATKTMVSDLPEPWVCQTTPSESGVSPPRRRSTILWAARYCWYRQTT